jgi:2-epi-5-epi-valiolone synthase
MVARLCRNVVADRNRSYCVSLCPGLAGGNITDLAKTIGSRKSLLVTTPTVSRLYAAQIAQGLLRLGIDVASVVTVCSEESKNLSVVEKLCHECFCAGLDRTSVLIGCGGGVCTDLVTMAASLTRRGLNYIRVPTTLIGLIDASIGIKGAVNLPGKKSAIGCFHPPEHVFLDPAFLASLPKCRIAEGLAELIKVAIVTDVGLFELTERYSSDLLERPSRVAIDKLTELVWRSTVQLLDELEPNIYEDKTYCRLLDFGHTFSPLIESESDFRVSHGLAVSIDIAVSTALAFELGLLARTDRDRILILLRNVGLPIFAPLLTEEVALRSLVAMETHRGGHLNLVLPERVGSAVFVVERARISADILRRALDFLEREGHAGPSAEAAVAASGPRTLRRATKYA